MFFSEGREGLVLVMWIKIVLCIVFSLVLICLIGMVKIEFLVKVVVEWNKLDGVVLLEFYMLLGVLVDVRISKLFGIGDGMVVWFVVVGVVVFFDFWVLVLK